MMDHLRALLASSLLATCVAIGVGEWTGTAPGKLEAALPGMATVTGTVTAPSSFSAAQVYLRNTDKGILHMVYTQAGRFRATPLFPGNYEVTVIAKGLASDKQRVTLKVGDNPALALTLHAGSAPAP